MSCAQHFRILRWTNIIGRTLKVCVNHKSFRPHFTSQLYLFLSLTRQMPDIIAEHEPKQYHFNGA